MKKALFIVLVFIKVCANTTTPLSTLQQQQIKTEQKINDYTSKKLKYDWINPITASYTYTKNGQFDTTSSSQILKINLNQPIFKSGGIYFAIKYSNANREFLKLATSLKEKNLISKLYEVLLNLKKIDLQIKKQSYMIDNANIDIFRKKEQFQSGLIDSSFLNSAILNATTLKHQLLNLQSTRFELIKNFENLSDQNYTTLIPPKFTLLDKEEFLKRSLDLKLAKSEIAKNRNLKNMMISSYFPTLSLFGNYSKNLNEDQRSFIKYGFSYGINISMPLFDINRGENIELRRLELLKSKLEFQDKQKQMKNFYESIQKKIEILQKRVNLAKEDEKLYDELLKSAQESYMIGQKSSYDVDSLRNSKNSSSIDIKIYEIDIELELLKLFMKVSDEI